MELNELKNIVESLLFVTDVPLPVERLKEIIGRVNDDLLSESIEELKKDYIDTGRSFTITEVAGGLQLSTLPHFSKWIKKMYQSKTVHRLSKPALETLAIIAFKQPITRTDIESIRGVECGQVLAKLLERKLIIISGRDKSPGKPLIYVTTSDFLRYFGLNKLSDLPRPREIEELLREREDQQQDLFIEEEPENITGQNENDEEKPLPENNSEQENNLPPSEDIAEKPEQSNHNESPEKD